MKKDPGCPPAKTVEEYLSRLPETIQGALRKLRQSVKAAAPAAEEVISYQIPTYKQNGPLVHFAAFPDHCSFFVVNKNILKTFEKELESYKASGATIHFSPENPLPSSLVQKIVKRRIQENQGLKALTKSTNGGKKP